MTPEEHDESPEEAAFQSILTILKTRKGIDLGHYKRATLNRRINRRMMLRSIVGMDEYAELLLGDPSEVEALYRDALINVTTFFRDGETFDALRAKVFPRMLKGRAPSDPVRVWVPACSTGEEAYTIAMALLESEGGNEAPILVHATDVNEHSVATAAMGVYPAKAVAGLPRDLLGRYFTQDPTGQYVAKEELRRLCMFTRHNALTDPPFDDVDMISCRNLLIYLDDTNQERLFRIFYGALREQGYLILGKSESATRCRDLFEEADGKNKVYVKRPVHAGGVTPRPPRGR